MGTQFRMTAQAYQRLRKHLDDAELRDLAHDIAEDLEAANPTGAVMGEDERNAILNTLMRGDVR